MIMTTITINNNYNMKRIVFAREFNKQVQNYEMFL